MNFKGVRKIQDRNQFYKPENDSDEFTSPFFIISAFTVGLFPAAKQYERQVYEFMGFLGDVGGLADAIIFFGLIISTYLTSSHVKCIQAELFNKVLREESGGTTQRKHAHGKDKNDEMFP